MIFLLLAFVTIFLGIGYFIFSLVGPTWSRILRLLFAAGLLGGWWIFILWAADQALIEAEREAVKDPVFISALEVSGTKDLGIAYPISWSMAGWLCNESNPCLTARDVERIGTVLVAKPGTEMVYQVTSDCPPTGCDLTSPTGLGLVERSGFDSRAIELRTIGKTKSLECVNSIRFAIFPTKTCREIVYYEGVQASVHIFIYSPGGLLFPFYYYPPWDEYPRSSVKIDVIIGLCLSTIENVSVVDFSGCEHV